MTFLRFTLFSWQSYLVFCRDLPTFVASIIIIMKINVFCSANNRLSPVYFELTAQLGHWIGSHGHHLVYGGANLGLMECLARAVHESGGHVTGVVPTKIEEGGLVSAYMDECVRCATLSERKRLMLEASDVVVALPGGLGTLDEIFSVVAEGTLGYHNKRVVVYNMEGFWTPLSNMLDDMQQRGMMRGDYHRLITFADDLTQLVELLEKKD